MPKKDFDYTSAWPYTRVNEQGERVPCTAEYNAQLMARLALNPGFSDAIYAIVNVPEQQNTAKTGCETETAQTCKKMSLFG